MDDQSISWMISGGLRAESRESRLDREHRQVLRNAGAAPHRDRARRVARAPRVGIPGRDPADPDGDPRLLRRVTGTR